MFINPGSYGRLRPWTTGRAGRTVGGIDVRKPALLMSVLAAIALAGCGDTLTEPTGDTASRAGAPVRTGDEDAERGRTSNPRAGTALAALGRLTVKGRAPKTGYDREQFGGDWASVDGCDTRQQILARDVRRIAYEPGSTCEVASGVLADRYTGAQLRLLPGSGGSVDIDHVVALSDAWQKGAQQWPYARRVAFANDPLNLLAVDASANRQKGDGDAATWLPANKAYRCTYVARQIAVKRRYRAWVTAAERDAMHRVLTRCPDTPLPRSRGPRISVPAPQPAEPPGSRGSLFANCDAVRAAGRAPLLRGDPAYAANPRLDRDRDGVACEP